MSESLLKSLDNSEYEPAGITKIIPNATWKEIAVIENESQSVWIQKKHLKEFPDNVSFEILNDISGVKVLFNGVMCGLIMPVGKD